MENISSKLYHFEYTDLKLKRFNFGRNIVTSMTVFSNPVQEVRQTNVSDSSSEKKGKVTSSMKRNTLESFRFSA